MNLNIFKSSPRTAFPRCEHRSPSGRQCSQPVCNSHPQFCGTHKPTEAQLTSAELAQSAGTLSTPAEVHRFLIAVTLLRVRGKLSNKDASTYSYLCQSLQRGMREIAFHEELQAEREERDRPQQYSTWSIPRPDRDGPSSDADEVQAEETTETPQLVESYSAKSKEAIEPPTENPLPANVVPTSNSFTSSTPSTSSNSLPSSTSKKSSTSSPASPPLPPSPPFAPDHFYPIDFTLPPGMQDPVKNLPLKTQSFVRRRMARRAFWWERS